MEKFDSKKHSKYFKYLPFSYMSLDAYLDCFGYVFKRNGEYILVGQDCYFPHEFPAYFLPQNKSNWRNLSVTFADEDDENKIKGEGIEIYLKNPVGTEYFYETKSMISSNGKFAQRIRQFEKKYEFKVFNKYSKKKIVEFYDFWKKQKNRTGDIFFEDIEFFQFCLDNLGKYKIKQIYVEINGKLVGLAWGVLHSNKKGWIGLHLKVDYQYKGLSRFLYRKRAELFQEVKIFSLGTEAKEEGLAKFKKELGPRFKKTYYYLATRK